jgi:transcriptional regulator with XRE-family HTH domain
MTTGDRISLRRKQLGISADKLAEKLNVSRSTVFRYENGDIEKVPAEVIKALSTALRTSPAYLLGFTDDPEYEEIKKAPTNFEMLSLINKLTEEERIELWEKALSALKPEKE